jgi:uncharacterized membrane protein YgcG
MKMLKITFTSLLILSVLNLFLPEIAFAEQGHLFAKAEVTKHRPEILSTPEQDIPVEKVKKTSFKWIWVLLGVGAVGAVAAGGGGGGGDSGGGSAGGGGGGDSGASGDVSVTW